MTYQEAIEYLFSRLPMFQRVGKIAYKKDLTNTLKLCEVLHNPQTKFKSIHIAGTNGKGSTSSLLASILQEAGYKVGLYTSPHLKSFTERIRINGQEIPASAVISFVERMQPIIEEIEPSFFEATVALCFDYFANEKVDIAIIEVGLGGRLDSTNIITPELSIITNISWDHTDLLGDTLPKIASEKAGIIKTNIPLVIGEKQPDVADVFQEKAMQMNAPLYFAADRFRVSAMAATLYHQTVKIEDLSQPNEWAIQAETSLTGNYQLANITTVAMAASLLRESGWQITEQHIQQGLQHVAANTGLAGRMQLLNASPLTLCDTGHNKAGIAYVVAQLRQHLLRLAQHGNTQLHIVLGMVSDKDHSKILALLPTEARYYFVRPDVPRGLDAPLLQAKAADFALQGSTFPSVAKGLTAATSAANSNDLIFVGGSTFVVAEVV